MSTHVSRCVWTRTCDKVVFLSTSANFCRCLPRWLQIGYRAGAHAFFRLPT
jgi:hypothetical protein